MRRLAIPIVVLFVVGATFVGPPHGDAAPSPWKVIALWKLNEGKSATTARDSGPHGLDASIGALIEPGRSNRDRTYVHYPAPDRSRSQGSARLLVVGDARALDPRDRTFRVTATFRTSANGVNVVQKGQATTPGGYFKLEIYRGKAACLFRGGNGSKVSVHSEQVVNDGRWHTVACTRYDQHAAMRVDGSVVATTLRPSGSIDNGKPLTIGGKASCGGSVECDYFAGDIDAVRISHS